METTELPIAMIEATAGTQVRRFLDPAVIEDYAESMKARAIFPPVIVFAEDGSQRFVLADGFHRLAARKKAGLDSILCEIRDGTVHDALAYALGANDDHGLRRTNKDKRNAVEIALKDPEWSGWSAANIAALCRVSDHLVSKVREELVLAGEIDEPTTVKTKQKGKTVERPAKNKEPQRKPKSQDEVDRGNLLEAISVIRTMPYSGADAWHRLNLSPDVLIDMAKCIRWMSEYMNEHAQCARENIPPGLASV